MKYQGGNKYALPITVKFDKSTRRFGRISFKRLFKLTKRIALLFYILSPYLLSCMRDSIREHGICKVFAYIRNSLLARKIKHLANIET